MQIETPVRYYFIKMAKIKIVTVANADGHVEKSVYCWWECKIVQNSDSLVVSYSTKHVVIIWHNNCTLDHLFHKN